MTFRELYKNEKAKPIKFIQDVASAAGVTEATVRQWISGTIRPSRQALMLIEQHLNIPSSELFPPREENPEQ